MNKHNVPFKHVVLCKKYAAQLIPLLRQRAKELGYALLFHGSFRRDIDAVAIPWVEDCTSANVVAESLRIVAEQEIGQAFMSSLEQSEYFQNGAPGCKPHGRLTWAYHLGGGPYIDLSVMPTSYDAPLELRDNEITKLRNCLMRIIEEDTIDNIPGKYAQIGMKVLGINYE